MDKSLAQQTLDSYLRANNAQITDINTYQAVIRAMDLYAASAVSEAKDEDMSTLKAIKDKDITLHTEAYLGEGDASTYFAAGARWMRDKIIKLL